jgi:curved DNA-binding protein CbpA
VASTLGPRQGRPRLSVCRRRYEVLSDPQKRSIYDTRGEAGLTESGGMGGMDPQVRSLSARVVITSLIHRLPLRTYSASYSVAADSLGAAAAREIRGHARARTSFTG